jgi:hypothetical protein
LEVSTVDARSYRRMMISRRSSAALVRERRLNVLAGEAGVRIQQVGFRGPFGELPEDRLDRDARAANHRLPEDHVRIDLDALVLHRAVR